MIKFRDSKLKEELITSINILDNYDNKYLYINFIDLDIDGNCKEIIDFLQSIKSSNEKYTQEEIENLFLGNNTSEIIINGEEELEICLDEAESTISCTITEFIDLVKKATSASINDDGICISDGEIILRASVLKNDLPFESYENIPCFASKVNFKDTDIDLYVSTTNNLYSLNVFFSKDYNEDYPVIHYDDLFINISFPHDMKIKLDDVNRIFNIYIYEIFIQSGLKFRLSPRDYYNYCDNEDDEINFELDTISNLNSNLFTKGMSDVIALFNQAEGHNNDRAIVEYVKVIEYVSATVINQNQTQEVQKKLKNLNTTIPSADYINELGDIFSSYGKRLSSDSERIKATIKECCDIKKLSKYAPKFLNELKLLNTNLSKENADEKKLCDSAYGTLSKSISDTRNNLSHAKTNYDKKGLECPDNEKKEFILLLRELCMQVITWFSNTDEAIRVINE